MMWRSIALWVLLLSGGCQLVDALPDQLPPAAEGAPPPVVPVVDPSPHVAEPVAPVEVEPTEVEPPSEARNPEESLRLAANRIEAGDDAGALPHLVRYLHVYPERCMVRAYLAELFWRQERLEQAAEQYDRFIRDAQQQSGEARKHLIHVHSRRMQIAQSYDDAYNEHLHRGIGLYLLARQQAGQEATRDEAVTESLLCKAAGELTQAHERRPHDARPNLYLFEVWTRLAQRSTALRHLAQARESAAFSPLTPAEQCSLYLAVAAEGESRPYLRPGR